MTTRNFFLLFFYILGILLSHKVYSQESPVSNTAGTMTFTIKSITNNTTYSPKNCIAIWIKDSQGNFVVSRKVMAASRKQHLVKWNTNSGGNSVSATTGATLSNHQTHTITWDGKNASGADMADGLYQIWVEYTSTNSAFNGNAGPSVMVEFEKGPVGQHLTPTNATYYQNIVLDWVPLGVGASDLSKAGANISLFPNPMTELMNIELHIDKKSQVAIYIHSIQGEKVSILEENILNPGTHTYQWEGLSDKGKRVKPGTYILDLHVNGYSEARKIIVNK